MNQGGNEHRVGSEFLHELVGRLVFYREALPFHGKRNSVLSTFWYNDEHAMTLGIRQVTIKKPGNIMAVTNYPITTYPGTATCVTNPSFGSLVATGPQAGVRAGAGGVEMD